MSKRGRGRKTLYAVGVALLAIMLGPVFAFLFQGSAPPEHTVNIEALNITFRYPLSPGDKLEYLVTLKIMPNVENASYVPISNQTVEYEILDVKYPYLKVRVNGVNATVPATLLALPGMLLREETVDIPVKSYYLGDSFCLPMNRSFSVYGIGFSGSTPGFCKKAIVFAVYDRDGVLERMTITIVRGEYVYLEEIQRIIRVRHGDGVEVSVPMDSVNPTCLLFYSPVIYYTLPGAYTFSEEGKYLLKQLDKALDKRPLIVLRKSDEAQRVWDVLREYRGPEVTVLVTSPALVEADKVAEILSGMGQENVVAYLPDGQVLHGADAVIEYLKNLEG